MSSGDGAVGYSVGLVTEGSRVRGSGGAMLSRGGWFTEPEMRTGQDMMAMRLSNARELVYIRYLVTLCAYNGSMRCMLPSRMETGPS